MTEIAAHLRRDTVWRRTAIGLLCLIAAIAIIVLVTRDPASEADAGPVVVSAGTAITDPSDGRVWEAPHGTWSLGRTVRVVAPDVLAPNLLTTKTGSADYTMTASLLQESTVSGFVFRYRNDTNYWFVQAAPNFGTWRLVKVLDGVSQGLGALGELTCCRPGVVMSVSTARSGSIVISIDGVLTKELDDQALAGAQGVGYLATDTDATRARFGELEIVHETPDRSRARSSGDRS